MNLVCSIHCVRCFLHNILFRFYNNPVDSVLLFPLHSEQTKAWEGELVFANYLQYTMQSFRLYLINNKQCVLVCVCVCVRVCVCARMRSVAELCLTLCRPMNCSLPGSSVHGILQARILEWIFPTQGSNMHLLHLLHQQEDSLSLAPWWISNDSFSQFTDDGNESGRDWVS